MALRLGFRAALPKSRPPKQAARPRLCATQAAVESVRTEKLLPFVLLTVSLVPLGRHYQTAWHGRGRLREVPWPRPTMACQQRDTPQIVLCRVPRHINHAPRFDRDAFGG